jgi:hypothetical protein
MSRHVTDDWGLVTQWPFKHSEHASLDFSPRRKCKIQISNSLLQSVRNCLQDSCGSCQAKGHFKFQVWVHYRWQQLDRWYSADLHGLPWQAWSSIDSASKAWEYLSVPLARNMGILKAKYDYIGTWLKCLRGSSIIIHFILTHLHASFLPLLQSVWTRMSSLMNTPWRISTSS